MLGTIYPIQCSRCLVPLGRALHDEQKSDTMVVAWSFGFKMTLAKDLLASDTVPFLLQEMYQMLNSGICIAREIVD